MQVQHKRAATELQLVRLPGVGAGAHGQRNPARQETVGVFRNRGVHYPRTQFYYTLAISEDIFTI